MKQTTILITLSDELKLKLENRCQLEGISRAELGRRGIELYLEGPVNMCPALKEHFNLE